MTLIEVLAPYGIGEDEFVEELSRNLQAAPDTSASQLTEIEAAILREHGGIPEPAGYDQVLHNTVLRSAASNLAAQARDSLSVEQAATMLAIDGSRVRHRVRDRALYGFKIGGGLRLRSWQFHREDAIPGLRAVLAALPQALHRSRSPDSWRRPTRTWRWPTNRSARVTGLSAAVTRVRWSSSSSSLTRGEAAVPACTS